MQVTPLAALPSAACVLAVAGSNIAGPDNTVFARSQGAPSAPSPVLLFHQSQHSRRRQ